MTDQLFASIPVRVLLVDDDNSTRDLLRSRLVRDDYAVIEATNGQEAIEQFIEHNPDLVLLDSMMPVMDGVTACAHIRQLPNALSTPIIMVTALDDRATIDAAFAAGASDYVHKPFNWTILRHRIRLLVLEQRAMSQMRLQQRAMDAARHSIVITDSRPRPTVLYMNPAAATLFRIVNENAIGRALADLLQWNGFDPAIIANVTGRAESEFVTHPLASFRTADGEMGWAEVVFSPVRDDHGETTHYIWTFQDVTSQITVNEEQERSRFSEHATSAVLNALNHGVAIGKVIQLVLTQGQYQLQSHAGLIYLLDADSQTLRLSAQQGVSGDTSGLQEVPLGQSVYGQVAEQQQMLVGPTSAAQGEAADETMRARGFTMEAVYPLSVAGTLQGIAAFYKRDETPFDPAALEVVRDLMVKLSLAVERDSLYKKLKSRSE